MTQTKHEQIITKIEQLKIGTKLSVRKMAKEMGVSEGTAYRAFKEAENLGLISTRERIGTVRIEKKQRSQTDKLTFAEIVDIVDGRVLGGALGLQKTLGKFVIGAMQLEAMLRYIESGSLLIVGNREKVHVTALELGAGILITGGFRPIETVVRLADRLELPIISCSDDTFSVAAKINRAIFDRLIMKKIMLIEDIVRKDQPIDVLKAASTVAQWHSLRRERGQTRFPVVDEWNRVIGIVASRDVENQSYNQTVDRIMTRNPITAALSTSIASAAHTMAGEGVELLPIVDTARKLLGVVSRKEVMEAMQTVQQQPQIGDTFEDLIWNGFHQETVIEGGLRYRGIISPRMSNRMGTVSEGVLTSLMNQSALLAIQGQRRHDAAVESTSIYFIKPLQIGSEVEIVPELIDISRRSAKVEVSVADESGVCAKALYTAQFIYEG